ncbi:serine threonine- kinase cot-1 protein [Rutstroemia sp. NJR-2017a WRK4]|nr:serine threonine- kinase cot-1 protein [Rutstroemia sp. NJR-2017a WRK4]PQE14934.1 serine threonine- kinase cot-1 protein [Rutstroemia sp. NJR-2017a WRK4]
MDNNSNHAGNINPNANNANNRLFLNFGNDRFAPNDRAYPTTPSTFPNPIFPGQGIQQQQQQTPQTQQPYTQGFAPPTGYFMNNPYPSNYPQQPPASAYSQQQQQQQQSYQQRPMNMQNDSTNGLVHQFSHQNLGGGRGSPYGGRQASPGQRPRTAGAPGQQPAGYSSYLNPMPTQASQQSWPEYQPAPERNPDKYGSYTHNNQKKCSQLAADFFKDSVKRARDRNVRQSEMEQRLADPNQSQSRREQTCPRNELAFHWLHLQEIRVQLSMNALENIELLD